MINFLVILLLFYGLSNYEDNFHLSSNSCYECHEDINKPKLLIGGPDMVCKRCHPSMLINHKVGVITRLNRENLPLDEEGRITCAYTCHNVHPEGNSDFEKKLLRMEVNKICFSCHDK